MRTATTFGKKTSHAPFNMKVAKPDALGVEISAPFKDCLGVQDYPRSTRAPAASLVAVIALWR